MNAFLTWLNTPAATESYVTMHKNIDAFIKTANATFEKQGFPLKFANWFSVWSMMFTKPGRYHWMARRPPRRPAALPSPRPGHRPATVHTPAWLTLLLSPRPLSRSSSTTCATRAWR